ncbi:mitochondrial substrate carrier family protein [Cavenderia fasciculata]|uniref:Mitochondrial substrate carrier family protein n=1 Tax=Cavenderia fasciculata TaxID=261658 RepID=F4PYE1_CACFS|nr:mitochondrial substrate carrier family protein [Cavenderia fasciculata]EGG19408.1 mitochondrial substrate carrier family protein [Cavenderia fasciculata]|eukprot:XP_004357679.1 mitochondrial substrate carrier family protein [Cavenderia fasciculata]
MTMGTNNNNNNNQSIDTPNNNNINNVNLKTNQQQQPKQTDYESQIKQFITGGLAGMMAAAVTHPIDSLKVRMQLQGELSSNPMTASSQQLLNQTPKGSFSMLKHIHETEDKYALLTIPNLSYTYSLSASLLRQATYTTTRFGLYDVFKNLLLSSEKNKSIPFHKKVMVGMLAGAGGAIVGTPADVIMVRMQADGKLPPDQRRNYKSAFNGISRITKEEGFFSLWRGCSPNILRSMFMTAGQISSYDQAKQMMLESGYFVDNIQTHLIASTIAAFVASLVTSPLDVVKTRIMNTKTTTSGSSSVDAPRYKGSN